MCETRALNRIADNIANLTKSVDKLVKALAVQDTSTFKPMTVWAVSTPEPELVRRDWNVPLTTGPSTSWPTTK